MLIEVSYESSKNQIDRRNGRREPRTSLAAVTSGSQGGNCVRKVPRDITECATYLLAAHLELDPTWDHKQRWIDDVELSLSFPEVGTVHGTGKMWWGHRRSVSAALVSVDLQARLRLLSTGTTPAAS